MPFAPTRRMPIEIIHLPAGYKAPPEAYRIRITELARGVELDGNIPVPEPTLTPWGWYANAIEAEARGTAFAQEQGCAVLYVEAGH